MQISGIFFLFEPPCLENANVFQTTLIGKQNERKRNKVFV